MPGMSIQDKIPKLLRYRPIKPKHMSDILISFTICLLQIGLYKYPCLVAKEPNLDLHLIKICYPHAVNGSQWTTSLTLSAYMFTKVA